jgi:hypothetical protein
MNFNDFWWSDECLDNTPDYKVLVEVTWNAAVAECVRRLRELSIHDEKYGFAGDWLEEEMKK